MPKAALHPCAHPGCTALVSERTCEAHRLVAKRAIDRRRGNAGARGYDERWRRLRALYLAEHPLCECDECQAGKKLITAATVVDHRIPIAQRPDLRLVWTNLRSMSKAHHDRHTALTQGFARPSNYS